MLTNFTCSVFFKIQLYISLHSISQFAEVQVDISILFTGRLFGVIVYQNIES